MASRNVSLYPGEGPVPSPLQSSIVMPSAQPGFTRIARRWRWMTGRW